jgi:hypothetical protein
MAAMNEIERFGREIGSHFGAEKVLLFGLGAVIAGNKRCHRK